MAHNLSTGSGTRPGAGADGQPDKATKGSEALLASILWVLVLIALTYGVWQTVARALRLFTA